MTPPRPTRTRPGPLGTLTTFQRSHIANARPDPDQSAAAAPHPSRTHNADLGQEIGALLDRACYLLAHPRIIGTEAHRYCVTRVQYIQGLPDRFAAAGVPPGEWLLILPPIRDRLDELIVPRLEAAEREGRSWATRDGYLPAVQRDVRWGHAEVL